MCPLCIASAALLAAGTVSTGGILAVYIGKLKKHFTATGPDPFHKAKEK